MLKVPCSPAFRIPVFYCPSFFTQAAWAQCQVWKQFMSLSKYLLCRHKLLYFIIWFELNSSFECTMHSTVWPLYRNLFLEVSLRKLILNQKQLADFNLNACSNISPDFIYITWLQPPGCFAFSNQHTVTAQCCKRQTMLSENLLTSGKIFSLQQL